MYLMQMLLVRAPLHEEVEKLCHAEAASCSAASDKVIRALDRSFADLESEMNYIWAAKLPSEPQGHVVRCGR